MRKLITEIVERELQSLADELRVGDGLGQIAKDGVHSREGAQGTSAICSKQTSGTVERHMMTNRGQYSSTSRSAPLRHARPLVATMGICRLDAIDNSA